MRLAELLQEHGMTSGMVFATGLMKGKDAARMVADAKAQETIRPMTDAVLHADDRGSVADIVDRLGTFYHSEYVKLNQPWVLETPFEQWRDRELAKRGMSV